MARISLVLLGSLVILTGCSPADRGQKSARFYEAGEKATAGPLTYSVVDGEIEPALGDDPNNPRTPQNRFIILQVAVSNGSNADVSIPGMTLVDDSGQSYPELPDGSGVPKWFGVLRTVSPAQTENGAVVFDAPVKHYRLRLTEDGADEVSIDIPIDFLQQGQNRLSGQAGSLEPGR